MESPADYRLSPPANWATEDAQADNRMLRAAVGSLITRIEKAEARALKAEALLKEQDREDGLTSDELNYERQMRQQTEEAMVKLAGRVKEQQDELAEQEVDMLRLIQETYNWSAAVKKLEAERIVKSNQEDTCIFTGCKNGQVYDGACECYVNGRAHGEEANA